MTDAAAIELYVGAAIEYASEREVLAVLIERLSSTGRWAAIFANIHIGGRQIDFVVATDSLALVVEAKHFSGRVRGKVNGLWQMHVSGSAWKNVGNPYLQALQAKNVLRDQLQASYGEMPGYPDACVVIARSCPPGQMYLLPTSRLQSRTLVVLRLSLRNVLACSCTGVNGALLRRNFGSGACRR